MPELLDHLRAGYRKQDDAENLGDFAERWERVKSVQLLLLDDLGVQVNSPWVREHIDSLIDARYRAGRPTAITTNLSDKELTAMCPRAFDRLDRHEPAAVVEMLAIKYRVWKRHNPDKSKGGEIPW